MVNTGEDDLTGDPYVLFDSNVGGGDSDKVEVERIKQEMRRRN